MTRDAQATWMPSPFYTSGRPAGNPRYIILHGTAGGSSALAIANWFRNPNAQAAAHYVIGPDGLIVQCVDEDDWAWANGFLSAGHDSFWDANINPNWITISIEHVNPDVHNQASLTDAQIQASIALTKRIAARWGIPLARADASGGITGHYSIDPVNRSNCPGNFPWTRYWNGVKPEEDTMLELTNPVVATYFKDGGNGTWKCTNGVVLLGANLTFYRSYGGPAVLGLPLHDEIYPKGIPNVAIVPCERALIVYDPGRKIDNPPIAGPCYLLHLDKGIGQQLLMQVAQAPLQAQIQALQAQLIEAKSSQPELADCKDRLLKIRTLSNI